MCWLLSAACTSACPYAASTSQCIANFLYLCILSPIHDVPTTRSAETSDAEVAEIDIP